MITTAASGNARKVIERPPGHHRPRGRRTYSTRGMEIGVPLPFAPPLDPMLAKAEEAIPEGEGWCYEPKWDGFRTVAFKDGANVHLSSRNGLPMQRYFPEV